ncbi:MAG: FkbM family methyltransferase [Dehalococcoidia bacterium]
MPSPTRYLALGRKAARTAVHPGWWRALRLGVAPSLELRGVAFHHDHRTVIDVGAGRGQFALFARRRFPDAEVYSLEPGTSSAGLFERVHGADARVHLRRCAAGAEATSALLHLTSDADSSSLLPLAEQASRFGTPEVATESVEVAPLDALLPSTWERPALLKIDVQGAELDVLRGAERTVAGVDEVLVEVSYVPLYREQARADEVVEWLAQRGFDVAGEYPSHREHRRVIQSDLHFVRRDG